MSRAWSEVNVSVLGMEPVKIMKETLAIASCASSNHPDLGAYVKSVTWNRSTMTLGKRNLSRNRTYVRGKSSRGEAQLMTERCCALLDLALDSCTNLNARLFARGCEKNCSPVW